jgi:tol-pal system protein YbgF
MRGLRRTFGRRKMQLKSRKAPSSGPSGHLLPRGEKAAVLAAIFALTFAAAAQAQPAPDAGLRDRVDRLERQLDEVRAIVLQARSTGRPVEIKEAGPDPMVTDLQGKFDDMNQTLTSLNGQVEGLAHDLDTARKDLADARAQNASLADRVDKLEKAFAALQPAPSSGPPPQAPGLDGAPPDQGAAADGGDPKASYEHARQLMLDGDYPGAAAAFQGYIDHWANTPNAPTARYWLGEIKYVQQDYAGAAQSYVAALRGWPATAWAPDATVRLALSLAELNRPKEACGALDEFDRRYAKAPAATKARAAAAREKAKCSS